MANTKKGSSSQRSQNRTQSRGDGSSRKSTGAKSSGKGRTSKNKRKTVNSSTQQGIVIIFMLFLAIFLCLCTYGVIGGAIGPRVGYFVLGIFGIPGYLMPIGIFIYVSVIMSNRGSQTAILKLIAILVLVLEIGVLISFITGEAVSYYADSNHTIKLLYNAQNGGGVLFGGLACILYKLLGNFGTIFLSIVIILICSLIISERSLIGLIKRQRENTRNEYYEESEYYEENDAPDEYYEPVSAPVKRRVKQPDNEAEKAAERERRRQVKLEQQEQRRILNEKNDDMRILNSSIEGKGTNGALEMKNADMPLLELKKKVNKNEIHEITVTKDDIYTDDRDNEVTQEAFDNKISSNEMHPDTESSIMAVDNGEAPQNAKETEKENEPELTITVNCDGFEPDNLDISDMPEPVTERTHEMNEGKDLDINATVKASKPRKNVVYKKPSVDLLIPNKASKKGDSNDELKLNAAKLQKTLATFNVDAKVSDICQGPSVTRYELTLAPGTPVKKIVGLQDDLMLNLAAEDIRIEAPIPGKSAVGIEIPNSETRPVLIRELMESSEFKKAASDISFAVGKDISGKTIVADIAKMPHMLIAGSTGSGKSVCINTLIMSILYKANPEDVKLIMIDPKVVELSVYNGIPHLLLPVVTNPNQANGALKWAVNEMDKRYKMFANEHVRDINGYNDKIETLKQENPELTKMPRIVLIVDELADLMMVASKDVEASICRIAQLARAAGIHLIIATQRPSVDVITGLIKANMPSRVAFKVSSGVDSRTILDMVGAEHLLGKGDMLFYPQGYNKPLRVQGAYVSDDEVSKVVGFLAQNTDDDVYDKSIENAIANMGSSEKDNKEAVTGESEIAGIDEYFEEACRLVISKKKASITMLQRAFRLGFNRAARIIDQMEEYGIVGMEEGTKARNVLVDESSLEMILQELNK